MDSSLLCSVSSRGTCHIWKLDDESEKKSKFIEGRRSISQIQIPDFNAKQQSKWFDPGAFSHALCLQAQKHTNVHLHLI